MAKKEENILDYLNKGKEEILSFTRKDEELHEVCVKNGDCQYNFPKTYTDKNGVERDYKELLLKRWNSESRQMNHIQQWGTYSGIPKIGADGTTERKFEKALLYLSQHRKEGAIYYAIFREASKAPRYLQEYVYENCKDWMKNENVYSLNENIPFDVAERMPKAFTKGWENQDLYGFKTEFQLDDLVPLDYLKIGTAVKAERREDEGIIVDYHWVRSPHGGPYVIAYEVEFRHNRWDHKDYFGYQLKTRPAIAV